MTEFGLPLEATVYVNLEELAGILHNAQITGSLGTILTDNNPLNEVEGVVPRVTRVVYHEARTQLATALESSANAAPEGRAALTWGRLTEMVRHARLMGGLFILGKPVGAYVARVYKQANAVGFATEPLIEALVHRQHKHKFSCATSATTEGRAANVRA